MSEVKEFWQADENGVALISQKEVRRVSYDEFILRLQSTKTSTPILPYGTIWYEHTGKDKLFAIQLPPKKRTIPYYEKYYEIGFPSFIVLVKTSGSFAVNVSLAATLRPIDDFDSPLIRPPLPNMDDRGVLCLGYDFNTDGSKLTSEIARVRQAVAHVESSKYNDHLLPLTQWVPQELQGDYEFANQYSETGAVQVAKREYYNVLARWAEHTKGNDWLKALDRISWAPFNTFSSFIRGAI